MRAQNSHLYTNITLLTLFSILLGGCQWIENPQPQTRVGSCVLPLRATATDQEIVQALLNAEGQFVVQQDIQTVMLLWVNGGAVIDAKNTPDNPEDDQAWLDKDAIRHRYVRIVFPGAPKQVSPTQLQMTIATDRAVVTATTQIGSEISPAGDRWVLVKREGCWLIETLTYNLEPQK